MTTHIATRRGLAAALIVGVSAFAIAPVPAFAAGDGPSTTYSSGKKAKAKKCRTGRAWSQRRKKCVRLKSSSLTDDERYATGRELAYAGRYAEAIEALEASDKSKARTMNMLGFSHRKAGHHDVAMKHYQAALAIDPDYTLARSYMGLGLLGNGDRAGAEEQLQLIAAKAGTETYEYKLLADALKGGSYSY